MAQPNYYLDLLVNSGLYSDLSGMQPPPSERRHYIIPFEITTGCNYGRCEFCDLYSSKRFHAGTFEENKEHIDKVWSLLNRSYGKLMKLQSFQRVFLGSGNALSVETETLSKTVRYIAETFKESIGINPRRIASYASVNDILKKGFDDLDYLRAGKRLCNSEEYAKAVGLNTLYIGMESGSDEILSYVNKGYSKDNILEAAIQMRGTGINSSIMIMPGLGGMKYYHEHIENTSEVLNDWNPKWITFLGTQIRAGTLYASRMGSELEAGTNRPLSDSELVEQTAAIIDRLTIKTKVGLHGSDIMPIGNTPVVMGSKDLENNDDARRLAKKIRSKLNREKKFW